MNSKEKIAWRERLQNFQRDAEVPWWKFSFAESLLEKAFDYFDVGQERMGAKVLMRLKVWLMRHESHQERQAEKPNDTEPFRDVWDSERLKDELDALYQKLIGYQSLIPRVELEDFKHSWRELQQLHREGELELQHLRKLRVKLIQRVKQSLHAVGSLRVLNARVDADIQVEGIGPYNNRYNFGETFKLLSSSDPIWAGDFLELYNSLFGLEDKIASKVLKR